MIMWIFGEGGALPDTGSCLAVVVQFCRRGRCCLCGFQRIVTMILLLQMSKRQICSARNKEREKQERVSAGDCESTVRELQLKS